MVDAVMRAVRFHRTGGPEVLELEQVPKPVPGEGEVLVRVMAAGVIPYDWKVRKGVIPVPLSFPVIAGYAFAGIVEAAGPGTSGAAPGERVYGRSSRGTYADYTVVKPASMAAMPKSLGFIEAAALQGGATTAWRAVIDGEVKAGDRVLIHGAAGGVGLFAVQFAKARGAYVYGTASAANLDYILSIGVDEAIDYAARDFADVVRDADFVLDTVGGKTLEHSLETVKPGGILLSIVGEVPPHAAAARGIRVKTVSPAGREDLEAIARMIDAGAAKPVIQKVFPLEEAREAHRLSETGHGRGRIVLRIG